MYNPKAEARLQFHPTPGVPRVAQAAVTLHRKHEQPSGVYVTGGHVAPAAGAAQEGFTFYLRPECAPPGAGATVAGPWQAGAAGWGLLLAAGAGLEHGLPTERLRAPVLCPAAPPLLPACSDGSQMGVLALDVSGGAGCWAVLLLLPVPLLAAAPCAAPVLSQAPPRYPAHRPARLPAALLPPLQRLVRTINNRGFPPPSDGASSAASTAAAGPGPGPLYSGMQGGPAMAAMPGGARGRPPAACRDCRLRCMP